MHRVRRDRARQQGGLTEEQKQEIRCVRALTRTSNSFLGRLPTTAVLPRRSGRNTSLLWQPHGLFAWRLPPWGALWGRGFNLNWAGPARPPPRVPRLRAWLRPVMLMRPPAARRPREAFDLFDTDGSGTIDAKELKVAMRCVPVAQPGGAGVGGATGRALGRRRGQFAAGRGAQSTPTVPPSAHYARCASWARLPAEPGAAPVTWQPWRASTPLAGDLKEAGCLGAQNTLLTVVPSPCPARWALSPRRRR